MFKKVVLGLLVLFLLILGGIATYVLLNEDKIKRHLISAINDRLTVPVDVNTIVISPLSSFPDVSVNFKGIKIVDPHDQKEIFATAREVAFEFNIWELIKGEMVLEQVEVFNARINIIQYTDVNWSYQIYKDPESQEGEKISFDINKILLKDISTNYYSHVNTSTWKGDLKDAVASLQVKGPVTWIEMNSSILSEEFGYKEFKTLQNQSIVYNGTLILDKHWKINSSVLKIGESVFSLEINKDDENIEANVVAENANIKSLLNLAPAEIKNRLSNYSSNGNISFTSEMTYNLGSSKTSINSSLSFTSVEIKQNEPQVLFKDLGLNSTLSIPDLNNITSASLTFSDIDGFLNNNRVTGELQIKNFSDPHLKGTFNGTLPLPFIKDVAGLKIENPTGFVSLNVAFQGLYKDLTNKPDQINASGEASLDNISFNISNRAYPIEAPAGIIIFNNDHLAINDLRLIMGKSDFFINGQLRNFWNLTSNKAWSATADIHSESLMLDELLSVEDNNASSDFYSFHIPSNVSLDINATVGGLKVRKFGARNATGKIMVKNNALQAEKVSLQSMGGMMKVKGEWRDLKRFGSEINLSFLLAGINADSLFYSFENFNQGFITDKNLSGDVYAEAETSIKLDSNLVVLPNSLNATLKTKIIKGQLKNFDPLYRLEKYLDDADLGLVNFSELENQIIIQNSTVHLPMMVIGTNIVKFRIGGTHTFDQDINYHVVAPLVRKKKKDADERFGKVADDQHGESLLFLSITGTTDDFEVSLDKQAVKEEIASDVKREIKELQDAFKNNGKTSNKEVELTEDEFFDWDDDN